MSGGPHPELELKAVVPDPATVRDRLLAAGARPGFRGWMRDRRFDRDGQLSARDEVLRVRTYHHPDGEFDTVLAWKGPTRRSPEGYKQRDEVELPVAGGEPDRLLSALGYVPVHTVDRRVEVYDLAGAAVRLEWYPRMDVLLEIEGDAEAIERAVPVTGIPRSQFSAESLADFTRRYQERTGLEPMLAGDGLPADWGHR